MANDHVTEEMVDAVRRTVAISREHARAILEAAIASAPQAALSSPQPSEDEVERVARAICEERTWPGAWDRANEIEREAWRRDAKAAICKMFPRPQPGTILAARACEIVGAIATDSFPASTYQRCLEAINTIRMEAAPLPEPPKE